MSIHAILSFIRPDWNDFISIKDLSTEFTFVFIISIICYRDEEGTASVGVVVCCDGDEEERETSIMFSTSGENDGLLPEMKVKNTN